MADEKKKLSMVLRVAGKDLDLAGALPLNMGDLEDLEANSVDMSRLTAGGTVHLLWHLCKKLDKDITRADVRAVSVPDMARIMQVATEAAKSDPTSSSLSTSSPASTDGAAAT